MKAGLSLVRANKGSVGDHCTGRLYRRISVLNITPREPAITNNITAVWVKFNINH